MKRKGYGQVEPNHLSAQYTAQIYAQLPAKYVDSEDGNKVKAIEKLENGQFLKYNYAAGRASVDGDGEWMLVFNEVKLYDERHQNYKDFVVKASDMTDGTIYPRLLKTNIGDIFTTNTFKSSDTTPVTVSGPDGEITMPDLSLGDYLVIGSDGWLVKATGTTKPSTGMVFQVVPHFTQIKDNGSLDPAYVTNNGETVYNYHLGDMQDAVKVQRIQ